ncbi:adhesion G protein-coupled receptor B1-like [Haliotis rufescens]|uniref:adhesion G protein-coupled receptor B1-like n=1 Tax=Haliotis rufescens TaxID=6454 RepID=UPI00201F9C26|nr:adhesion G protein-coupled receptor B1-like [Haliotis rufescens]
MKLLKIWFNTFAVLQFILHQRVQGPVVGIFDEQWSQWSGSCSPTCGSGRTISYSRVRSVCTLGFVCSLKSERKEEHCLPVLCPVDGVVSTWSVWNDPICSVTCGASATKIRSRTRTCTPPRYGGNSCPSPLTEAQSCGLNGCPVDGVLSIWTAWTNPPCSVSCGASATKMRVKTRTCTPPQYGGKECTGNLNEAFQVYCGLNDCPVDGGYAAWSEWSPFPCSATCGINATTVRTRSRSCTNPVQKIMEEHPVQVPLLKEALSLVVLTHVQLMELSLLGVLGAILHVQ